MALHGFQAVSTWSALRFQQGDGSSHRLAMKKPGAQRSTSQEVELSMDMLGRQLRVEDRTSRCSDDMQAMGGLERAMEQLEAEELSTSDDLFTEYSSILRRCGNCKALAQTRRVHAHILNSRVRDSRILQTILIETYGKCGSLREAVSVFSQLSSHSSFSWNFMIKACIQNGRCMEAMVFFRRMNQEGERPNRVTLLVAIEACTCMEGDRGVMLGKEVHSVIVSAGMDSDTILTTSLLNMYGRCGSIREAEKLFHGIQTRDVVAWNAMIAAYARNGHCKEAIRVYHRMLLDGIQPSDVTLISVLDTCASLAAISQGRKVHEHVVESGLEDDLIVGTALVSMYGKCGRLVEARRFFDRMKHRNVVTWTAMIAAYAQHGQGSVALKLHLDMELDGVRPNGVTFMGILFACGHTGMLERSRNYFLIMRGDHGIRPLAEHFRCIVDLLGRAGKLEDAEELIRCMPAASTVVAWTSFLGACSLHGKEHLGEQAAATLMEAEPDSSTSYAVMSNIYAAKGKWKEKERLRRLMESRGVKKEAGWSSIEVNGRVHEFICGDRSHPKTEMIYAELARLRTAMKDAGYVADTKTVLHKVESEARREKLLWYHSERLAIAYGLISTPSGSSLVVIKNLRVCSDCHTATKFISKVCGREIIVRDVNRFHRFHGGTCSCGDYW